MATSRFVDLWTEGDDSVATDRANAVLSVAEPGDRPEEVAVTIRDPRADGNSLSYQVNVLDGTLRTSTGSVALFIDPFGRPLSPCLRLGCIVANAVACDVSNRRRSRSSERAAGPPAFEPWPHR